MEIKKTQEDVRELMKVVNAKHGFAYPNIMSIMKAYEEMGELTSLVIESTVKSRKGDVVDVDLVRDKIGGEVADVMIVLFGIANDYDVDLEECVKKKMAKHKARWDKV